MPDRRRHRASIHWPTLCEYGRESAALYRTYLSASAVLDHTDKKGEPAGAGGGQLERMLPTFAADELHRALTLMAHCATPARFR